MSGSRFAATLLACTCAFAALPAAAQFAKADDAIEYREGALAVMGHHFGVIGAMVKGKIPYDASMAQSNADIVAYMSKLPWAGFGPGTQGGKAKPEIWQEEAKFKELQQKMIDATANLAVVAKAGDAATLKTAFGAAGESCKACHDNYRKK